MPVFRTPDGKIVEEKSKRSEEEPADAEDGTVKVPPPEPDGEAKPSPDDFFDKRTKKVNRDANPDATNSDDLERTRVFRRSSDKTLERKREEASESDAMRDPVVGWLVVIAGPGCGEVLKLGYGMNSIGRSDADRVSLMFGDTEISRHRHAVLTYDPKKRKFFLQQGEGDNLTYLNDENVLQLTEIESGCHIELGNTLLKFVALCGAEFDWQDQQSEA